MFFTHNFIALIRIMFPESLAMTVLQEVRNAPRDISGPNDNTNTYIDNSYVDMADLQRWKLEMCEVDHAAVKARSKALLEKQIPSWQVHDESDAAYVKTLAGMLDRGDAPSEGAMGERMRRWKEANPEQAKELAPRQIERKSFDCSGRVFSWNRRRSSRSTPSNA